MDSAGAIESHLTQRAVDPPARAPHDISPPMAAVLLRPLGYTFKIERPQSQQVDDEWQHFAGKAGSHLITTRPNLISRELFNHGIRHFIRISCGYIDSLYAFLDSPRHHDSAGFNYPSFHNSGGRSSESFSCVRGRIPNSRSTDGLHHSSLMPQTPA